MAAGIRETMARESLRIRGSRARYFPEDIFAEHAWVLLLHAYLHHIGAARAEDGESVPPLEGQVMRHWRRYLEQQGLIVPDGAVAAPPVMTAEGVDRMERYLDHLAETASELR